MNPIGESIPVAESVSMPEFDFRVAVLIPVYEHADAIGPTLNRVMQYEHPVLLVDDGSGEVCQNRLRELSETCPERVFLLRLDTNRGKGGAVKAGFQMLWEKGYTHAVQIDADGQHNIEDLPGFVAASRSAPTSLITGYPQYDNVPMLRYYGRYLTHVWIWINTLSIQVRDSMCGYRVYPLGPLVEMLEQEPCGNRMEFDPEVLVRWCWRGGAVINLPTRVTYPLDGVSHFNLVQDNLLISWMHTRLFFGMLYRLPKILWHRLNG